MRTLEFEFRDNFRSREQLSHTFFSESGRQAVFFSADILTMQCCIVNKAKFQNNLKQSTFYHLGKLLNVASKRMKSVVVVFLDVVLRQYRH